MPGRTTNLCAAFGTAHSKPTEQFWYHNAGASGLGGSTPSLGSAGEGRRGGSYIDDVILRDRDTDGNGTLDERRYYLQNQHHDVVALINTSGSISERVNYDPYGSPIETFTSIANRKGYAGYEYDAELGDTYHVRHRVYRSDLGVWIRRDPLAHVDGMGLYEYVASMPTTRDDPYGQSDSIRSHFPPPCPPQGPCIPIGPFRNRPPYYGTSPVKPWIPTPYDPVPIPQPTPIQPVPPPGGGWFDFDIDFGYSGKCCFRTYGVLVCVGLTGGCQHGPCRCCPTERIGMETKCKTCVTISIGLWGASGCKPSPDVGFSHDVPPRDPGCCGAVGDCDGGPLNNLAQPPGDESVEGSGGMGLPEEER